MTEFSVTLENVTKTFGRRLIFQDISQKFTIGKVYGIAGNNGSGKSTLSKIIAGILSPSSGKVNYVSAGKNIIPEKLHNFLGFVSPYLVLYDEFTAAENLLHFSKIRGIKAEIKEMDSLLEEFGLSQRKNDLLRAYSSGMKQRMKFIFALLHHPPLLILDEPTSNLDVEGKNTVYNIIKRRSNSSVIIIASNEESDLSRCDEILELDKFKIINSEKNSKY